jgi:hypothetical protein
MVCLGYISVDTLHKGDTEDDDDDDDYDDNNNNNNNNTCKAKQWLVQNSTVHLTTHTSIRGPMATTT